MIYFHKLNNYGIFNYIYTMCHVIYVHICLGMSNLNVRLCTKMYLQNFWCLHEDIYHYVHKKDSEKYRERAMKRM